MADYAQAYDFAYFSAKPQVKPEPEREGFRPKIVVKKEKSTKVLKQEQRHSARAMVKVMIIASVLFAVVSVNIYSRVVLNERVHQLETIQSQIDIEQSENIRLNNKLNGAVSLETVEKTAASKFHMVKKENSQITYVEVGDDTNSSNGVVS